MARRIKLDEAMLIGSGNFSEIYAVGDKAIKVSKLYPDGRYAHLCRQEREKKVKREAQRENKGIQAMRNLGLPTPKPQGVVRVLVNDRKARGCLMQKINGKTFTEYREQLSEEERNMVYDYICAPEAKRKTIAEDMSEGAYFLAQKELERMKFENIAEERGFDLGLDRGLTNAMIDEEGKVVLIDFQEIRFPENYGGKINE